jgi:hypothetical protein
MSIKVSNHKQAVRVLIDRPPVNALNEEAIKLAEKIIQNAPLR